MLIVEPGNPQTPQVTALLQASHALMQEFYPPEDNYALSVEELCQPDIHFFVARQGDLMLGTGAYAQRDGYGEVKAMFTSALARGQGVATALLHQLEDHARAQELTALKLETGEELTQAVRLYERHGFTRCGPFGDYSDNPFSIFMEKAL